MARSLWKGSISFGLVNVPVRLYSAVAHKEIHFHLLHRADGGRIQLKRFCSIEGKEVPYEQIIRGYEVSKGRYVPFEQDELEQLDFKTTHSIDIEEFVDLSAIDPMYFDTPYHVGPDERGARAYGLLTQAMIQTGKVAIARMVLRSRQSLCALRPHDGRLVLSTMQYADELVAPASLDIPRAEAPPKGRELEMAQQLIQSLSATFEPRKYRDTYRERVLELVEKKAVGEQLVGAEPPAPAGIINLAEALAASLARARHPAAAEPSQEPESRRAAPRRSGRTRTAARARRARS